MEIGCSCALESVWPAPNCATPAIASIFNGDGVAGMARRAENGARHLCRFNESILLSLKKSYMLETSHIEAG
jgi:hypothetical protein